MDVSVIVPAYNSGRELRECLAGLRASSVPPSEVLVVDDAATDDTAAVAAAMGARVLRLAANAGPAAARNRGAAVARGDVLFFVDADVVVAADAVARVARALGDEADLAAVFGSYDARPRAPGLVSQFRNLLHHFVHQHGRPDASTFWAGCGAVRRAAFDAVGGFDERPVRRFIEDIELGYRLRRAGFRIRLDHDLRCTHLKHWTLWSMLRTDLVHRAVPWARLIAETRTAPADLNLRGEQRASVALVGVAGAALLLAVWRHCLAAVAVAAILAVAALNRELYRFLRRERGVAFALACFPLHLLHLACSGLGFVYARSAPRRRA
jgi:GT2 family glycosyltransferase